MHVKETVTGVCHQPAAEAPSPCAESEAVMVGSARPTRLEEPLKSASPWYAAVTSWPAPSCGTV